MVLISEVAKRSEKLGGFIAALPLMTLLTLTWLYIENQSQEKIANHAYYTFWYVIPTLPMFLLFPYLLPKAGFWMTMGISIAITVICLGLFVLLIKKFGIKLLWKKSFKTTQLELCFHAHNSALSNELHEPNPSALFHMASKLCVVKCYTQCAHTNFLSGVISLKRL